MKNLIMAILAIIVMATNASAMVYTVEKNGETVESIATKLHTSEADIWKANSSSIEKLKALKAGDRIEIPISDGWAAEEARIQREKSVKKDTVNSLTTKAVSTSTAPDCAVKHKVKKGETIGKLMDMYDVSGVAIRNANPDLIKNLNIIRVGWDLCIPDVKGVKVPKKIVSNKKPVAAKVEAGNVRYWKKFGANPFGGRNVYRAIDRFDLEAGLKARLKDRYANSTPIVGDIPDGTEFDQQVYGDFLVWNGIIAMLGKNEKGEWYKADYYKAVEWEGYSYELVIPHGCNNVSWIRKPCTEKAAVAAPPVEKEVKSPPPPAPTPKAPETFGPPAGGNVPLVPGSGPGVRRFDWDMSVGYFHENVQGYTGKVDGEWMSLSLYPLIYGNPKSQTFIGLDLAQASWKGENGGFYYAGNRLTYGPAVKHRTNRSETILKVGYGYIHDEGNTTPFGGGGTYSMEQDTRVYTGYLSGEYRRSARLFSQFNASVSVDLDKSGSRKANWTPTGGTVSPLPEDAGNKTAYSVMVSTHLWEFDRRQMVALTAGAGHIYYKENDNRGARAWLGVALFKRVAEVKFYHTGWTKTNDTNGVEVMVNVSESLKRLFPSKRYAKDVTKPIGESDDW